MDQEILRHLQGITGEERAILDGRTTIDRELYMQGQGNIINAKKLLAAGKLITIRPHTRFIHFPEHTHDYVEVVYMCSGHTTHIVNGKKIVLEQGDLLFLSQSATHEVCRAEETDVAVNFIVKIRKPIFMSEYGADTIAGNHKLPETIFSEEYQIEFYKENHRALDDCEFVIGEHPWAFADFMTSAGLKRFDGNKKGIFTRQRQPKSVAFLLRDRWHNK